MEIFLQDHPKKPHDVCRCYSIWLCPHTPPNDSLTFSKGHTLSSALMVPSMVVNTSEHFVVEAS